MKKIVLVLAVTAITMLGAALGAVRPARAQAVPEAWVRIEAQPTLRQAQDAARGYAERLPDVQGYALAGGWYAIVLGPYAPDEARAKLRQLRADRQIPRDSFVSNGAGFGLQYWPIGGTDAAPEAASAAAPGTTPEVGPETVAPVTAEAAPAAPAPTPAPVAEAPAAPPVETLAEARRAEAQLDRTQREAVQEALKWEGVYSGGIDGAFGRGTRGAMADWQSARGDEPTGVLTTAQRDTLLAKVAAERAALGLVDVTDEKAGIAITLPMGLIKSARYDPPFARYEEKNSSGVEVILISEPGDAAALSALYDILQTLRIVPMSGPRSLGRKSFTIEASNDQLSSYSYAALKDGFIKGYMLVWKPGTKAQTGRILTAMKQSFRPVGKAALDAAMVPTPAAQRRDLMSGLELRKAAAARTGFFVDDKGTVVTTTAVLRQCARLTVGAGHDAQLVHEDRALGLAVLAPKDSLAPSAVAEFDTAAPVVGDPVAVAGYSYGGKLSAPVLSFGTLEGLKGLGDKAGRRRLALKALPGDAGGPVFDRGGAVIGMLLPRAEPKDGRILPANARSAADADALLTVLRAAGVKPKLSALHGVMAPEDLSALGAEVAVLVQCWK